MQMNLRVSDALKRRLFVGNDDDDVAKFLVRKLNTISTNDDQNTNTFDALIVRWNIFQYRK